MKRAWSIEKNSPPSPPVFMHLDVDALGEHGDVAAADELLVARLVEQRLADREQHDHHRDAHAEAEAAGTPMRHGLSVRFRSASSAIIAAPCRRLVADDRRPSRMWIDALRRAREILVVRHDDDRRSVAR